MERDVSTGSDKKKKKVMLKLGLIGVTEKMIRCIMEICWDYF